MEIVIIIFTFLMMFLSFLIMLPIFGFLSLSFLSPFSWLYVLAIGLLFVIQIIIPKNIRKITIVALSSGIIMMWIALFISCRDLPDIYDLSKPVATGGFPITAFEYPPGALGSNVPPGNTWKLFYLNLFFWIVIGAGVAILLRRHLNKKRLFLFFVASVIISIYGLGYLLLKFD